MSGGPWKVAVKLLQWFGIETKYNNVCVGSSAVALLRCCVHLLFVHYTLKASEA